MNNRVEINAGVMQGKPVIRGTRIPAELLLRKLAEGATTQDLLDACSLINLVDAGRCPGGAGLWGGYDCARDSIGSRLDRGRDAILRG